MVVLLDGDDDLVHTSIRLAGSVEDAMLRRAGSTVASTSRCTLLHHPRALLADALTVRTRCAACSCPQQAPSWQQQSQQPLPRRLHVSASQQRSPSKPSSSSRHGPPRPLFQGNQHRKSPVKLPLPSAPTRKPTVSEVREALGREMDAFVHSRRMAGRLVALGVKGDAARALLLPPKERVALCQMAIRVCQGAGFDDDPSSEAVSDNVSEYLENETSDDDVRVAEQLLQRWRRDVRKSSRHQPETGAGAEHAGTPLDLNMLMHSYTTEGTTALQRACAQHFLDWFQQGIHDIAHSTAQSGDADDGTNILYPIQSSAMVLHAHLSHLLQLTNYLLPAQRYKLARTLNRQIHLHIGPTNSGKTYRALLALTKAERGMYAGPLRLLAHEVFERINEGTIGNVPPRACNLITGEEQRIVDLDAGLTACTVEMADLEQVVDVAVVDEIQMIADPNRGSAWTAAVLGLPAKELHLCGEAAALPLIRRLAALCDDELHVHTYQRLTPLRVADRSLGGDLSKIEKGDCIVTFARSNIFHLKRAIESRTGLRCAVAYGALPPETRSEQARRFNDTSDQGLDVMVASDAIGMGLNLKIKRVIFETCSKWDGGEQVLLSNSQIKQIAGRAGRYGTQDGAGDEQPMGGVVTTLHEDDLMFVHAALASGIVPIERAGLHVFSDQLELMATLIGSTAQVDRHLGFDVWSTKPEENVVEEGLDEGLEELEPHEVMLDLAEPDRDPRNQRSHKQRKKELEKKLAERERRIEERRKQRAEERERQRKEEEAAAGKPVNVQQAKLDNILKVIGPGDLSKPASRPPWYDPSRAVSTLYSLIQQLVRFDPSLFFLPSFEREHGISPILEACARGQLTIGEKDSLGKAPATLRDERVVVLLSNMIRGFGRGQPVRFEEAARDLRLLEVLESVEQAVVELMEEGKAAGQGKKDADSASDSVGASSTGGDDKTPPSPTMLSEEEAESQALRSALAQLGERSTAHPILNLQSLTVLESLHRGLTLYLWLHYRFVLAFVYRAEVSALKVRTERAIEYVLAATRFRPRPRTKPSALRAADAFEEGEGEGEGEGDAVTTIFGQPIDLAEERVAREEGNEERELIEQWRDTIRPRARGKAANRAGEEDNGDGGDGGIKVALGEGAGGVIKEASSH